jgi:hypothetical protein
MTDDLVKKLTKLAETAERSGAFTDEHRWMLSDGVAEIAYEAANRIEQLENYLRLIAEHPVDKSEQWETGCKEMRKVARLALGEKKDGE